MCPPTRAARLRSHNLQLALQESDQSAARELISLIPKLNQKWLSDDSFIVKHLKWYHLISSVL